jgi:hypothetical protein
VGLVGELNQSGYGKTAGELAGWPVVYETKMQADAGVPVVYSILNSIRNITYENRMLVFEVRENPGRVPTA